MVADFSPLSLLLVAVGAVITVGSAAVGGLKLHRFLLRYAPPLAAAVPSGALILCGIALAALMLLRAAVNP
ncbi:MAG: hypothetical protein GEV13_36060 [Rhodospirillales bacterium]|nr:hypothetical protein [Rhodospirillales bacterium]